MLTQDQIDAIPGQPDGIEDESRDMPDPARAAERILAYVRASGDGLYEIYEGQPLYGRDLCSVAQAVKKLLEQAAQSDADHRTMDARATELEGEVERLSEDSKTLNAIGFAAAIALGLVPPGTERILADPIDQVRRLIEVADPDWVSRDNLARATAHLDQSDAALGGDTEPTERKLPVCADCGHRHRWGGECAGHTWGDSCPYDAGADCETAVDQPITQPAEEIN